MNSTAESKRIRAFRLGLARQIPRFPNDRASLETLTAKSTGALLIDYANWAIRYVPPRQRTVVIEPQATQDPRWLQHKVNLEGFLDKVRRGEDLTPHLSLQPHTRGFTPAASAPGPAVDRWADKDMILNITGYHHFHPQLTIEPGGFATRRNDVLFATVTRTEFTVIALFDHSVFDAEPSGPLSAERERLWTIFEERSMRAAPPGSAVILSMVATSGHSPHFTKLAMDYARLIRDMDPKLDEPGYVAALAEGSGYVPPARPKFKWYLYYLDLGVLEKTENRLLVLRKGPK
jgi:hypothetical protein